MAGQKGKSGRKSKREEIDYSALERYSVAYLLKVMRRQEGNAHFDDRKKFKIALEVASKRIGKTQIDASKHTHYTTVIQQLHEAVQGTSDRASLRVD